MQKLKIIVWRTIKVLPVVGCFFVLAAAPMVLKRKGLLPGVVAVILDLLPVICLIKAGVEIFTGDLIPNRDADAVAPTQSLEAAA